MSFVPSDCFNLEIFTFCFAQWSDYAKKLQEYQAAQYQKFVEDVQKYQAQLADYAKKAQAQQQQLPPMAYMGPAVPNQPVQK